MKIRMTSQAFTTEGIFEPGQILSDEEYSEEFLIHLAGPAKAAEVIESKMLETPAVENKAATPKKPLPKKKTVKKKK